MGFVPSVDEAYALICLYNKEDFHLKHAKTVSAVMRYLATKYDPANEEYWATVGMLHDIDFEQWPEEHCVKAVSLLQAADVEESVIRAVVSHGWGLCSDVKPERYMEKILFAIDELTGLIGAAALMRPTGFEGMEVKSVMKKFKDKKFAAGCSRDVISLGAEMAELELPELIAITLEAMQNTVALFS